MKLFIEIEVEKVEGRRCDEDQVFEALDSEWDGAEVYPTAGDAVEESQYSVTGLRLVTQLDVVTRGLEWLIKQAKGDEELTNAAKALQTLTKGL